MRYYLDTNILAFLREQKRENLTDEVYDMLTDYGNLLYTSSVCVHEFIYLCQVGKVGNSKYGTYDADSILPWLDSFGIVIVPVSDSHLKQLVKLPLFEEHTDPQDRIIIAQAIHDHIPLISSDHKFRLYEKDGLDFIFNDRSKA